MKDINFIQPIPEYRKKELRRWFLVSIVLMITMVIAACIFTSIQLKIHSALVKEKNRLQQQLAQFDATMEKQHTQKEEKRLMQTKLTTLNACTTCENNPLSLLSAIRNALKNVPLQSLTLSKNNFELQAVCTNAKQATKLVHNLSQTKLFKDSSLISLQSSKNNMLIGTIKGRIINY